MRPRGLWLLGSAALLGSAWTHAADQPWSGVLELHAPGPLMIRVPAAEISMGSTLAEIEAAAAMCASEPLGHRCTMQAFFNERPSHRVSVPSFLIDRTEVTWGEYARCVAVGVCRRPGFHEGTRRFERNDYPVTFVDWDDARRYCAFRGARLPREVEFERAARGPTGRTFPWGWIYNSRLSNHGRLGYFEGDPDDGYAELAPVGSFPQGATPDGIQDLAGNVAEWVEDAYSGRYDRQSTGQSSKKVIRGGGFASAAPFLRGAARRGEPRGTRRAEIGFRCARSVPGEGKRP